MVVFAFNLAGYSKMKYAASIQLQSTPAPERGDAEVARLVFETLKPLRAACVEKDYAFMAYLIEMTEVEAYRLMKNQPE